MRMGRRFARRLGLTADQRREVGKLREAMRTKVSSVRDALRAKRDEMHKLWQAEAPDRAAIVAKHAEMDPLRQQIREVRIDFRLAVHKLLTPAQRAKLHKMKGRRGPGWGRGKGPGPRED
jgi:Spy/CpxP family protein refolding chaperone